MVTRAAPPNRCIIKLVQGVDGVEQIGGDTFGVSTGARRTSKDWWLDVAAQVVGGGDGHDSPALASRWWIIEPSVARRAPRGDRSKHTR
jgi:hypothetical protein